MRILLLRAIGLRGRRERAMKKAGNREQETGNRRRPAGPRTLDLNSVSVAAECMVRAVLLPGVKVVLAVGWLMLVLGMSAFTASAMGLNNAAGYARSGTMNEGPSPAAQTSANMPQARLTIHYNRVFMQWLYMYLNKL